MPSGTHGRSPFGSGSLSSSSGSNSSFGTGSSRSPRKYYNGHRVYVFGHRSYYIGNGKNVLVSFLLGFTWFFLFLTAFAGLGIMGLTDEMNSARDDYYFYQNMIAKAEESPSTLIVSAKVKDYRHDNDSDMYYIVYEIEYEEIETILGRPVIQKRKLEGISYPVYTLEQAQKRYIDYRDHKQTIDVAVETANIDETTDSVPVEFKHTKLEEVYEYTSSKFSKNICTIAVFVSASLFVVMLVSYIVVFKKNLQEVKGETSFDKDDGKSVAPAPVIESNTWKCPYCGGINDKSDKKCSQCGASKR